MNTKYTIKNFRVFDEKGVTVDIKPITILTGCNSSGKSSIVKSMVLLNTFTEEMRSNYQAGNNKMQVGKLKLDFTQKKTSDLGNFRRIIHNGSNKEIIEFQYTVESHFLGETVNVSFYFALEDSEMNGGQLAGISISKLSGETIYSSYDFRHHRVIPCEKIFNLSYIQKNFFHFVIGQDLVNAYRAYENCEAVLATAIENDHLSNYQGLTKEELEEWAIGVEEHKKNYCKKYGEDELKKVITWFNDFDNIHFDQDLGSTFIGKYASHQYEIVEKAESYNTLFYVPIYEKICGLDKNSFRTFMESLKSINTIESELQSAIEMVVSAFEKSNCDTFMDYWHEKEETFFEKKIIWGVNQWRDYLTNSFKGSELNLFFQNKSYDDCTVSDSLNFNFICEVVMNIDLIVFGKSPYYSTNKEPGDIFPTFGHTIYRMFLEYVRFAHNDILYNKLHNSLSYIGTSIVNVKRLYPLEGNDDFAIILRRYFELRKDPVYSAEYTNGGWYPSCFINKWIQKLGIGKSIGLSVDEEGLGATIRLYKDDNDENGSLLAEQGYGVTQLLVILLRIELAIMENCYGKIIFDDELYMGKDTEVHQAKWEYKETTIAIEEPEVHLHPKMQSMLAEIFVDAYTNFNVHFIIETHSEYIIRKLQLLVANKDVKNSDISILYVYDEKDRPGYEPQVKKIGIRKDGMLNGNFGEGFFDEADMLSMFLLTAGGNEDV